MNEWTADITNNPDDDYNLIIEILNNDEYIGRIYNDNEKGMTLKIYETNKQIDIPIEWLLNLFKQAKKDLK